MTELALSRATVPPEDHKHTVYLGDGHDKPLSRQGGACPEGLCHDYASHCGRCGQCSGYQGHYFQWCSATKSNREFHFCCPGNCALEEKANASEG